MYEDEENEQDSKCKLTVKSQLIHALVTCDSDTTFMYCLIN